MVEFLKGVFTEFFEWLGVRCSECGTWGGHKVTHEREVGWGTNFGDMLFSDPYEVVYLVCTCKDCGYEMGRRILNDGEISSGV